MTPLILKMSVSLDGYVAPADGSADWAAAGRSPDGAEWVLDTVSNAGAHLVGGVTVTGRIVIGLHWTAGSLVPAF
jgi:hypothetical protein